MAYWSFDKTEKVQNSDIGAACRKQVCRILWERKKKIISNNPHKSLPWWNEAVWEGGDKSIKQAEEKQLEATEYAAVWASDLLSRLDSGLAFGQDLKVALQIKERIFFNLDELNNTKQ